METTINKNLKLLQDNIGENLTNKAPAPVSRWLGGTLVEAQEGYVRLDFTVREDMTNAAKILHGGIMSTMIDEVMGFAIFTLDLDYFFPTVNLTVDFMSATHIGDTVQLRSSITKKGRTMVYIEATAHNQEGKLLAKGSSHVAKSQIKVK